MNWPANGFYEWKKENTHKQPYYIQLRSGEFFAFAGLWSHWAGADGSEVRTCTIITTAANEVMQPIHHRMPVLLKEEVWDHWLDCRNVKGPEAQALLASCHNDELAYYPVSTIVNSPKNDSKECIAQLN